MLMPIPTERVAAISIFNSRTFWLNALAILAPILSLTEVVVLIPPAYMPIYAAVLAAVNIGMRTATVRPVAFIAPGAVKEVSIVAVNPPPPKGITD